MNYHNSVPRFKNFKADSNAITTEQKQFQEAFPELVDEEDIEGNNILHSDGGVSSFSESSSDSSSDSEEEKDPKIVDPINKKPKAYRPRVRKSILKSQLLTNRRQSNNKQSSYSTLGKDKFNRFKNDVEGRLPIRRPSGVSQMVNNSHFTSKNKNKLAILGKTQEELDEHLKEESKGELDYIGADENGDREDLNSFLSRSLFTNKFQLVWALTLFIAHTYHFLVLFYYLGIAEFPSNATLALQLIFEFVLIFDFILRI
jgi:hypothetical protein